MKYLPRTPADILFVLLVATCVIGIIISLMGKPPLSGGTAVITTATSTKPFETINLTAKAAIVWDIRDQKVLYQKNADVVLPLASLTKLMTALVALEHASPTTKVLFDSKSLLEEGDSGLLVDEEWQLKKLIDFTLVMSSNDGARAIATAIEAKKPGESFVSRMNQKAKSLNLVSLSFENPTGLDINLGTAGGYGSAHDVAILYEYILGHHAEIFDYTSQTRATISSRQFMHTAVNTNTAINDIPGIFASKTGTSDLAGGNLAIIADIGIQHPVVMVVLGSTGEGRFIDIEKLFQETSAFIALEK